LQAKTLTTNAIRECLRITKRGGEMRFGIDMNVWTFEDNDPRKSIQLAVEEGIVEACKDEGKIIHLPKPGEKYLYIIQKISNDEKQELDQKTD
jgi:uncharacterized linocin/CFP29 family protein